MKLTKTSAQAALAMSYLAQQPAGELTQARQVAEHLGIPTDSALKILQALVRQQLLRSQLGRSGGYQVLVPAEELTLLQIVEAIDGPIHAELPIDTTEDALAGPVAALRQTCQRSVELLRSELTNTTVADLAASTGDDAMPALSTSLAIAG
ncbi:MAG: Rrf2 family transcriptional regulator [Planctomycetota bacterium]